MELQEVFVWHIFIHPYSYPFILYTMSFFMLFINCTVSIYTSNIEHVDCISMHYKSALAIWLLGSEIMDFTVLHRWFA